MRIDSMLLLRSGLQQLVILSLISLVLADGLPRAATWASEPVGPDGPWNAVSVSIGNDSQTLSLFPGHVWQTVVPTSSYCSKNASIPHCAAGTYSENKAIADSLNGLQFKASVQDVMAGVRMQGSGLDTYFDVCDIVGKVPNCSLAMVTDQMMAYPGGQAFPLFAGCLSVGAPSQYQSFTQSNGPPINSTIFPWYLYNSGTIPSVSFGLHLGSASSIIPMAGSLNFGGYDKNRIAGDILTFTGEPSDTIQLTDVSINVIKGQSPFNFTDKTGLLASGNASIPKTGVPVTLDGCSPYLTLPKSTCDSISTYLPVTYNESLGLYMWNTTDSKYMDVMRSASTISFSFVGSDNSKSATIHVPIQHLNLTIDSPLVDSPVPYFPCSTGGTGSYVLGRAFLQDAFTAGNWKKNTWWLAQAAGPNIPANPNVVRIGSNDTSIQGNGDDWEASWDSIWSILASASSVPSPTPPQNSTPPAQDANSGAISRISTGAKAGIAVGVSVGALLILGLGVFFWKRKGQNKAASVPSSSELDVNSASEPYPPKYMSQIQSPVEVADTPVQKQPQVYEMS